MATKQTRTETPTQGVMTVEQGAITGDVTIGTTAAGEGALAVTVSYYGAKDTYTVQGSPAAGLSHDEVVEALTAETGSATSL